jgi:hypothetical protein
MEIKLILTLRSREKGIVEKKKNRKLPTVSGTWTTIEKQHDHHDSHGPSDDGSLLTIQAPCQ